MKRIPYFSIIIYTFLCVYYAKINVTDGYQKTKKSEFSKKLRLIYF